jgi:hypothetical protein
MKKFSFFFFMIFMISNIYSQNGDWESNNRECFCCSPFYNLPKMPTISGPETINCGTAATFSTLSCPGASYLWTVSPTITGTTGNTTQTFTIPATAPIGTYLITLEVKCGNKVVKNTKKIKIIGVENCTSSFDFTLTKLPTGFYNITAVPHMTAPGQEHWWGIQYNGTFPNCNTCASIPWGQMNSSSSWGGYINSSGVLTPYMGTGTTTGTSPYGISYTGFSVNKCVRITHYVKCCGVLKRSTYCFEITGEVTTRVVKGSDKGSKIVDEIVPN